MESVQYRDLSSMVPNPKNPRKWKNDSEIRNLAESIRKNPDFFEARPILLSDRTGVLMIIGGERRWEAARHLGLTQAPSYLFHNLTEEREDEIMNRDNVHSGVWDEAKLHNWDKAQLQSWGVDAPIWENLGLSTAGREGEDNYDKFVNKFKPKLTTDDCYTPQPIYEAVCEWVDKNITSLSGRKIIRPFFPGGDYKHHNYPEGCIVIDNPPFSISAQILDFYLQRNIPFFLFGNGLTLFSAKREKLTHIIIGENIEFENGANVNVGFFTNLCPGVRVWLAADLANTVRKIQAKPQELEKYKTDIHIQNTGLLRRISKWVSLKIMTNESEFISKLSDGSAIFGGGIILSDDAARRVKEKRMQAEEERRRVEEERSVNRTIGDKEREIIERLNKSTLMNIFAM